MKTNAFFPSTASVDVAWFDSSYVTLETSQYNAIASPNAAGMESESFLLKLVSVKPWQFQYF